MTVYHMTSWEACKIHLGEWALDLVYKTTLAWVSFGVSSVSNGACIEVLVCKQVLAYKKAF